MSLWSSFLSNTQRPIHKWKHYFPAYERHFSPFVNRTVTFLEIGCGRGGSLQMWKRFLGPHATIIGVDINPRCRRFAEDQIHIRIGNQSDTAFLTSIIDEFGPPDVVLDDGSHQMDDIMSTFKFLYPKLRPNSVYMVEDLHTAYWPNAGGGLHNPASFIEHCKNLIDELNADWVHEKNIRTDFTATTLSMHFYDSIVAFEKGHHGRKHAPLIPPSARQKAKPQENQIVAAAASSTSDIEMSPSPAALK